MIIDNGDLRGAGPDPAEDETPLVVDADGVKARAIPAEWFEAVAGRHGEIRKLAGAIHLHELAQGDAGDGRKAPVLFLDEKLLRVGIGEGLDHGATVPIILSNCPATLAAK